MEYTIEHRTTYRYPRSVSESHTVVHLQPRTSLRQYCTRYALEVDPFARVFTYQDRFGNDVQHFSIVPEHQQLTIVARSHVVTVPQSLTIPNGVRLEYLMAESRVAEFDEFLAPSAYVGLGDDVRRAAAEIACDPDDLAEFFINAGRYVHATFAYAAGRTTVRTTVTQALAERVGVCQDFAHVLIALARSRGIPARYASGYIFSGSDPVLGAEASHAWAEAYLPPYGWLGFDPTNDRLVDDAFVLVALGRDYADVSPTRGLYRGRTEGKLEVNVAMGEVNAQ